MVQCSYLGIVSCDTCIKWADAVQSGFGFQDGWDESFPRWSLSDLHTASGLQFGFRLWIWVKLRNLQLVSAVDQVAQVLVSNWGFGCSILGHLDESQLVFCYSCQWCSQAQVLPEAGLLPLDAPHGGFCVLSCVPGCSQGQTETHRVPSGLPC